MFNRQTPVSLSFQDKYILGFESDEIAFNSHLVLELEAAADFIKLSQAFTALLEKEPFTRMVPDEVTGKFYLQPFALSKAQAQCHSVPDSDLNFWWERKFNFEKEYAIRLLVVISEANPKIVFSFHHALYDGHAQVNFLKDFFTIYSGQSYIARSVTEAYHFRKYFLQTKFPWIFTFLKGLIKHKKKYKTKVKIARLTDHEPSGRQVETSVIELDRAILDKGSRKLALSTSAYISLIGARVAHRLLLDKGNSEEPIVLFITKSMRFDLKIMRAYQNLVGFIWMKIERPAIGEKEYAKNFRDTYKFRSSDDEIRKTLFVAALIVKLVGFSKLKELLAKKEKKVHDCTLIVSSGRTPADVIFPSDLAVKSLLARGTMHRSPGIGLMVTSFKNKDFITIEYLKDAFNPETIQKFRQYVLQEIQET